MPAREAKKEHERLYTIQEAAKKIGVSPDTLRRWDKKGTLSPKRTPGGQRRYSETQIESFLAKNNESSVTSEPSTAKAPTETLNGYAQFLTIQEAAAVLGISAKTLRRWDAKGLLSPIRTPGGQRRYSNEQLQNVLGKKEEPKSEPQQAQSKAQTTTPGVPQTLAEAIEPEPFEPLIPGPLFIERLAMLKHKTLLTKENIAANLNDALSKIPEGVKLFTVLAFLITGLFIGASFLVQNTDKLKGTISEPLLTMLGKRPSEEVLARQERTKAVLAAETNRLQLTGTLSFNLPATFNENVTAPNIVYSATAGEGITVAGGQTPTITNADPGSAQNIFGNIKLGSNTATAGSNTDTFEFAAGSNVSLSLDKTNKKLTITSSDANSGGDITAVNVGNGFSGGGTSGDVTISLDVTTTSTSTTTTANSGLETATSGLSLLRGCSDSQVLQWDATNVYWKCAAATSSFTLAGDSGTSQTISGSDTMTVAGGTNGIDTVASSTDTITLNFDSTEVGTTTWGSGSAFTWTFDAGSSDPLIAFTSNQMSFGAAVQSTITAHSVFDNPAITATSNQNFYKMFIDNNAAVTVSGSTTSSLIASLAVDEPNITATGTVTNATSLYIFGAPTEGASGNFALWVDNGESRFENTPVSGSTTASALTVVPAYVVEATDITISGIRVALDTSSNTDSGDVAYGVNVDDITTSSGPTEYAIRVGSGYDYPFFFELGTRDLRIAATAPSAGTSPLTATIPALGADDTFCFATAANCFGGGGGSGVTYTSPSTTNALAKFSTTTGNLASSGVTDDGTTVALAANRSLSLADGTGSIAATYSPVGTTSTANALTLTPKFGIDVTDQTLSGLYVNPNTNTNTDTGDVLNGVFIDTITASSATEYGLQIGSEWDSNLYLNDTTSRVLLANGGTIVIHDGTNTLCTITDSGTTGDLSCTGSITGGSSGTQGHWSRTSTTISPATANDIVLIANTNTTGADFAVTNTGIYTGTGVANITANSLTTGVAHAVSTTGLTTGSSVRVTGSGTTMQTTGELVDLVLGANTVGAGMTITSTGVYTGTGSADGLINVVANSLTSGLGSQYSFTGLTTGSGMKMTGSGATMQTGGELIDLALGANTVGAGITVTSTGAYTGTGSADGLINVVANSLTSGLGSQYSFTGLTTGSGMRMTGSGATMQTGGELIDLVLGANTVGAGITVTSTGAYTGTGAGDGLINVTANSLTTGYGSQFIYNGISTGRGINVTSTSTAYTTGNLIALDWTPGSATTATSGDLFKITIGANGTLSTGNLFNIVDGSSSLFSVSETQMTSALPANFTAAGDVSIAYDIVFTNPTASYIKSQAPLQLVSGETFNSSNLTLQTYNAGSVVVSPATGTSTSTTGLLRVDGTSATGSYASAYVNTTYNTSTASTTAYGIYNAFTNSNTTNADTVIGAYSTITDATTLANTLVAFDAATTMTGVMTTGTRNVYGLRSQPTAGAESTGGTTNLYGVYSKATGDVATGGTINTYGLYVADGGGDAAGTATNFGLYLEPITGAGENIGICFDCDTTFGTATVATGIRWGNETTTTQNLEIFRSNGVAAAQITIQDEAGTDILNGSTADFQINLGAQVAATAQRLCHNGLDAATGVQSIGDCDPTNADLAEWYSVTDSADEGDVVSIAAESSEIDYYGGKTTTGFVQKSQGVYDSEILGVISTSPSGEVLGEAAKDKLPNPKAVALVGRVPIKVSTENGPIVAGDYLTSSTTAGVAMRADKPGRVIGKAIQSYSGTGIGKIVVFVNVSFADPNGMLASLVIGPNGNVTSSQPSVLGAQTIAVTASETKQSQEIASSSATPRNDNNSSFDLSSDPLFASLQTEVASLSAKIAILQDSIVASASTSAFLQTATTSAVLMPSVDLSTALNEATISGRLTVLGRTTLTDLGVTGDITAGLMTIKGLDGEINTLAGPLRLQGLALQGIEMVAGNVKIDTKGNIVAKSITVEEIKVVAGKTTGSGTITAGTKTVDIDSIYVAANSRIFVTATTQTAAPLAVVAKKPGQKFTVSIPSPTAAPITFDWWIVNEVN